MALEVVRHQQARAAQLNLTQAIAVSPVLDPAETLTALQRGMPGYELYFVRKWLRSLRKKQFAWPDAYDFGELGRLRDLKTMTAELVRALVEHRHALGCHGAHDRLRAPGCRTCRRPPPATAYRPRVRRFDRGRRNPSSCT